MDTGYLKLIELVLLFGGLLAFGFWQLRSVDRDRRKRLAAEATAAAEAAAAAEARHGARPPADRAPDSD